ncbi:MAG: hypothetical protein GX577_05145 [Leptolinea sp.]|nr:hypothetical protein [Leptolinea sp.]
MIKTAVSLLHTTKTQRLTLISLALISFLSMSINAGQLGLYGDQWKYILQPSSMTHESVIDFFVQKSLLQLIGSNISIIHVINSFLFFLTGYLFFLWLEQLEFGSAFSFAASMLFVVSPAFRQPGAGFTLSGILAGLIFTLLSAVFFGDYAKSNENRRWRLVRTIVFSILGFLSNPYVVCFQGFVFLPLLINRISKENRNQYVKLLAWSAVNFLISIVILFPYLNNGLRWETNSFIKIIQAIISSFILSWRQIIVMPETGIQTIVYLIILIVGITFLVDLIKTLSDRKKDSDTPCEGKLINQLFSLIAILATGSFYLTILELGGIATGLSCPEDISMVVFGIYSSVALIFAVRILFLREFQPIVLAIIIGLSSGSRFLSAENFKHETNTLNDIVAQLHIRGDYFLPRTSILVEQLPLDFTTRSSFEAIIAQEFSKRTNEIRIIPADSYQVQEMLGNMSEKEAKIDIGEEEVLLSKDSLISLWIPEKGCLQVLSQNWEMGTLPEGLSASRIYSSESRFSLDNMSDVKQLNRFRTTIIESWCYYYQLAARASQANNWNTVITVYEDAQAREIQPERYQEYFPLLAALIHTGRLQEAEKISEKLIVSPSSKSNVCLQWNLIVSSDSLKKEVITKARNSLTAIGCK